SSPNHFVYTVSLYTAAGGKFVRTPAFATPFPATRIAAADLSGDGLDDLVVAHSLDNSITVALQVAPGQFGLPLTLPVGIAPSDLALFDVDGDGLRDIVVTDQASGDVTVLLNGAAHSFSRANHFRAGTGLYSLDPTFLLPVFRSLEQSVS